MIRNNSNNPLSFLQKISHTPIPRSIPTNKPDLSDLNPLEPGDYVPCYVNPDQGQDEREAAEIRAATEFLGY